MQHVRGYVKDCFSLKQFKRKLPIFQWLPVYNSDDLLGDVIAGLTVGLTVIPQGIAYANIAGLPANYGLYSSFMGCVIYVLFGSCKDITIGPTAIMSLLSFQYCLGNTDIAVLLCFFTGIITLFCGLFHLGFFIAFISKPVISGFTSAAAIIIATSQLKALFGLSLHAEGLVDTWVQVFKHITETRWPDLVLGIICMIILLFMKKLREFKMFKKHPDDNGVAKVLKMTVFLSSVGRNAIVVIGATILAAILDDNQPFIITGYIKPGLPTVSLPPFSARMDDNTTMPFPEIMSSVGSGIIILPLIAILENIAIGSAFSQGKTLDATQEMIALGLCNIVGSFFRSMPVTGSFSRTAVNATSGVRTTAGGIITAVLVILALAVLTPYFQFIPKSALAAVIICAVIFMIEIKDIKPIWRVRKLDQIIWWTTFLVCLFWELELGIVVGVLVNIIIFLIGAALPKVAMTSNVDNPVIPPHVSIQPRTGLMFLNVDKIRSSITAISIDEGKGTYPIVLDCLHFSAVDYSGSKGIQGLMKDLGKRGQSVFLINCSPSVERALRALNPDIEIVEQTQLLDVLKKHSIFTLKL